MLSIKKQKFTTVIAAMAIQLCLGVTYLWSIFQTGIAQSLFNGNNASASITFSLLFATISVGSIIGGKLSHKYSVKIIVISGGIILSLGFLLASFVTAQASWLLWLTYGVMGGFGMGLTYSPSLACAQNWFPKNRGIVTGLIVSALGFGGVVFTPIIETLIKTFGGVGIGEFATFRVLALIFLVISIISGLFLNNPPPNTNKLDASIVSEHSLSPKEVLTKPQFYFITLSMALACMGGMMMIGFAKPIAIAKGLAETATLAVLIISLFNAVGRFFWGIVSDKLGRKNTLLIVLICSSLLSFAVIFSGGYWIYAIIALIGFCYGGILSIYPIVTTETFGAKHTATNYGMVLIGFGIGAVVSSYIAGYYKDFAGNNFDLMAPAFYISAISALVAIILVLFLKYLNHAI